MFTTLIYFAAIPAVPLRVTHKTLGRVEIFYHGKWGTICDSMWSHENAEVACRQLGFSGGKAVTNALFGQGTDIIWLSHVRCSGTENNLAMCTHQGWGRHQCYHSMDAGIVCEVPGMS